MIVKNTVFITFLTLLMSFSFFSTAADAKEEKKKSDFLYKVNKVITATKSAVLQTNSAADNVLNDTCVSIKKKLLNKKDQTWVKGHYKYEGYNRVWCKGHWRKVKSTNSSGSSQGPSQE